MKEWICREISTATSGNENGVLMMETELIRCKECKYAYRGYKKYVCTRQFNDFSILPDGYCSLAERKEE